MTIELMLVLSTAHITMETASALELGCIPRRERIFYAPGWLNEMICWPKGDYGWFIYAAEVDLVNLPEDLVACLKLAQQSNCCWLMLDRDGDVVEPLPTYDWV